MQIRLDDGLQRCTCGAYGTHPFCGQCGRRHGPDGVTWRECPNKGCKAQVTTDWCVLCGTEVAPQFLKDMEAGKVDWEEESRIAEALVQKFYQTRPNIRSAPQDFEPGNLEALNHAFGG